jgi:predicted HicB family RNase H-like nuclease
MIEQKPRGRPRLYDGPPVSVRLPSTLHDALSVEALRRQMDLSELIRERLAYFVSQKAQRQTSLA